VKKSFVVSYLLILASLLILMSLSRPVTEKIRGNFIALIAPAWEKLALFKASDRLLHGDESEQKNNLSSEEELSRLQLENQLLNNELQFLTRLLENKETVDSSIQTISKISNEAQTDSTYYQSYIERMKKGLEAKIQAMPGRVIFRSLDTWNSFLWINVGSADNPSPPEKQIIAKNSPAVVGNSIVGVVDYVGPHQSRICLITDSRITPSVRAVRGGVKEMAVGDHLDVVLNAFRRKNNQWMQEHERQTLIKMLKNIKSAMRPGGQSWYLAKGELEGSVQPSGRTSGQILRGTGFNYDFSDEEGSGRDLRTGNLVDNPQDKPVPILKINDLLVTTGMDGIFPPDFKVATVTKIDLLKEGDYYYELEAEPTAGHLDNLSLLFILPPVGYDKD
jgi:rod shape-determining protein MreC